jgi:hypothetical protein
MLIKIFGYLDHSRVKIEGLVKRITEKTSVKVLWNSKGTEYCISYVYPSSS